MYRPILRPEDYPHAKFCEHGLIVGSKPAVERAFMTGANTVICPRCTETTAADIERAQDEQRRFA